MKWLWLFLAVYTVISIAFCISQLGYKNEKSTWWKEVILIPACCIAYLVGAIGDLICFLTKKKK
ncbi:hypothetical protein C9J01_10220 [Photobacterium rosenbergii]|uniref:Uncharacterized protein n=1 Tax=Photobacterium rosenbergii TaxID=294936 RepID=A0A2T3NFD0_9GAMM|nr:hypothetical protein C9J01_10220 [Photobacterium rosenbergii]